MKRWNCLITSVVVATWCAWVAPVLSAQDEPPTPVAARALARQGKVQEALDMMQACLVRENLSPTERAGLLFQTYQLYDPRTGFPRSAKGWGNAPFDQLRAAALVDDADRPTRWKILTELVDKCALPHSPVKQQWAGEALSELERLPDLTAAERLRIAEGRVKLAQVSVDYPALADALDQKIPLTTNLTIRIRLQLQCGDVASAFLKDKPRAMAQWRAVAATDDAHPYYRAVALEKLAHATLYEEPLPNHLLAPFPERQAMPAAQTRTARLAEALAWWQQALALPLANWVKLDILTGMARAHESCGKPGSGYKLLEQQALGLPGLNLRQAAEIKFIMAQLALAAGDRDRAAVLAREAAAAPHVRPQRVREAQALTAF